MYQRIFQCAWRDTAIAVWFEEIIALAVEFIGVILLAILGALVCLFDHFIFKSRMPRREDMQNRMNKRKER